MSLTEVNVQQENLTGDLETLLIIHQKSLMRKSFKNGLRTILVQYFELHLFVRSDVASQSAQIIFQEISKAVIVGRLDLITTSK